jgi:ribosomal protein S8
MQKSILSLIALFATITLCAQTPSDTAFVQLQQTVGKLQTELKNQKVGFSKSILAANENIKSLQNEINAQKQTIAVLADSLGVQITETSQNANEQIASVSENVSKKLLLGIVVSVVLLLLSVVLFVWLYRKQKTSRADIIGQLEKQKTTVEEQLVKEFAKQTEIMESLTKTLQATATVANAEPDHSLALKLADEITLMERNISHMNQETKGLKPLIRAIDRLKDNLISNGYEFVDLVGKQYNEGMKITIVSSIPDENLEKGIDIITKIIKPQVNHNNKMIQMAQVEVNVGVK